MSVYSELAKEMEQLQKIVNEKKAPDAFVCSERTAAWLRTAIPDAPPDVKLDSFRGIPLYVLPTDVEARGRAIELMMEGKRVDIITERPDETQTSPKDLQGDRG